MKKVGGNMLLSTPPWTTLSFRALLCLLLLLSVTPAHGEEEDLRSLELYNGESLETVTSDRAPRPASQTAENITVVTAKEIEALNAHTLADVLYTVAGIQINMLGTPGGPSYFQVQGSNYNHVLVLLDNVPINSLGENVANINAVPAGIIERVEVVKGAASSSWGSALGGVVNVITKSTDPDRPLGGRVSASFGKRETVDGRGELTGTVKRFGYFLYGGKLRSDGLLPNNQVDLNSLYGKLRYDLPVHGSLTATTSFSEGEGGLFRIEGAFPVPGGGALAREDDFSLRQLVSTLSLQYPLGDRLSLEALLKMRRGKDEMAVTSSPDPVVFFQSASEDRTNGATVNLSWVDDLQRIVAGVDYDHVKTVRTQASAPLFRESADRVGIYLNDTFTLGALAITPSARFDHTGSGGDLFSPSFGITYALTENSVLRGYTSRGYSVTVLGNDSATEKVWTSQVGFESSEIPYLWLKGTLFRNDTWDVRVPAFDPVLGVVVTNHRQLKQGYELELRTTELVGCSLSLSYTFIHAEDRDSDSIIQGVPRHTLNIGLKYDDPRYLRALLNLHYTDWNDDSQDRYGSVICDLHLSRKFSYSENGWVELFASVRNLFNGEQFLAPFATPRRWGEVGVRCAF